MHTGFERAAAPGPLSTALRIAPALAVRLRDEDLHIAVWRQRDRYYEIPALDDPVISLHVGGRGRVRFGDGDGWSRRSSTLGTVTFLPPGIPSRWLVEGGAVEHLTIVAGAASSLRAVVISAAAAIEVGRPDALNVSLARALVDALSPGAPDAADELYVRSLCETLIRNFAREHRAARRASAASPCEVTSAAIATMESRYAEPLSVQTLAGITGVSVPHFGTLFKKATGWTPHQYLLHVRVEKAREALRESDVTVVQIAHHVGFSSQSHLNAAFRKIMGMTPAQYRARVRRATGAEPSQAPRHGIGTGRLPG